MNPEDLPQHWALVTGASAGIGRAMCLALAAKGMHVVLVARRAEKLEELAAQIEREHHTRTLALPCDLSDPTAVLALHENVVRQEIHIRLLCNNAASGHWGRFEDASLDRVRQMLRLNVDAVAAMCHAFLPDLTRHKSSAIINVSSQAAYQPVPFMAAYAASKAFVHQFSQALHGEWRDRGVLVQTLVPGPTKTEFNDIAGGTPPSIKKLGEPAEVVAAALSHLDRTRPVVTNARGLWMQRLFAAIAPANTVIRKVAAMFRPADKPKFSEP